MRSEDDGRDRLVHDLRNHVAIVEGFAQLLARSGDRLTDEQRADYLRRILEAARQIKTALDDSDSGAGKRQKG